MSIDFAKYSEELRGLADAYYNQHISYEEYQMERQTILRNIENEMHGNPIGVDAPGTGLLEKALSHFKD